MDSSLNDSFYSINEFNSSGETLYPSSDQDLNSSNGLVSFDSNFGDFRFLPPEPDPVNLAPNPGVSLEEVGSPEDFSDSVSKFIMELLEEEDIEKKSCMFHDPLALQAAEKSFYEVIGKEYIPSSDQPPLCIETPDSFSSDHSNSSSIGPWNVSPQGDNEPSSLQSFAHPVNYASQSSSQRPFSYPDNSSVSFSQLGDSSVTTLPVPNSLTDSETVLLFRRGVEEASKFLPPENRLLTNYKLPPQSKDGAPEVTVEVEENERGHSFNNSRGRKNHDREDVDIEEGRSTKQSAVFVDEDELLEMFDRVLLYPHGLKLPLECTAHEVVNGADKSLQQIGQLCGFEAGKRPTRSRGNKKEVVDLRTLLILCAQAANADDRRTADELLKQIKQHSCPFGDGSQRVAHYFVDALEARLAGTGTQIYTSLDSNISSAADMLKAYQLYLLASPFKKIAVSFANYHILNLAQKSETIHIIDFGIRYGFQWPIFIQFLSGRLGKLSKLRITGIELPQPGFRPAERVEETGRRLATYCDRFHIPFEFNAIAQKWETIKVEDLKIDRNEAIAVNCFFRFENLLDETVVVNSPRDAVLKLIGMINPNIFTHSIVNGSYNSPYFITRFREALFHFSALFDMFDTNLPREDQDRLMFEKGFYGREIMNVIACEGTERVVRPEMYKQWQARVVRAGFKQLPLDTELMKKLKAKVKAGYNEDFVVNEDGNWMLQGWKGRILNAASCWVRVQES